MGGRGEGTGDGESGGDKWEMGDSGIGTVRDEGKEEGKEAGCGGWRNGCTLLGELFL